MGADCRRPTDSEVVGMQRGARSAALRGLSWVQTAADRLSSTEDSEVVGMQRGARSAALRGRSWAQTAAD